MELNVFQIQEDFRLRAGYDNAAVTSDTRTLIMKITMDISEKNS